MIDKFVHFSLQFSYSEFQVMEVRNFYYVISDANFNQ